MDLHEKISGKQAIFYILIAVAVIFSIIKISTLLNENPKTSPQPGMSPKTTVSPPIESKPETEKEYKASCKWVGGIDNGKDIYIKEFLKSPKKFTGTRLNIQAKIMSIEESNNQTAMQVYLTRNFDTAIVYFDGIMKIYANDIIRIYGEGAGIFEGQNRMGASMAVPLIRAKYIKKERSEDY